MAITLKIISYQRLTPGQQESFQTELERFSVGRNADNDLALPDPQRFMSGTHCWLENRDGAWLIKDTSTNGVFINGSDDRVSKNESVVLKQGDKIRLGDYELEVILQENKTAASTPSDPFADDEDDIFDQLQTPQAETLQVSEPPDLHDVNTPLSQMDSNLLGTAVSIDDLYHLDEEEETPEPPPSLASKSNQASPLEQHFSAPKVEPQKPVDDALDKYAIDLDDLSEDWDKDPTSFKEAVPAKLDPSPLPDDHETAINSPSVMRPEAKPAKPVTTPHTAEPAAPQTADREFSPPPQQTHNSDSAVAAFAKGAELDENLLQVADQVAFFEDLGALVKTMTEGLMQAIAARGQVKSEFRLEQTMIAPTENNPFKFSVSAQEAIMRLINHKDGAYLSGIAAAAEAVDDINAHQLAVMAGTEAALKSVMHKFNPARIEEKYGEGKAIPVFKKARFWELYKVMYTENSEAVDDDFQNFFGQEFSDAYEQQLDRIKISRKEPSK